MKKKAKQICFDHFIDSLFADVAPVINNHLIQHFCSSLCVPNGIHLQFVSWNKHYQLENLTRFSIFIRADAKDAEPTDGGAGASRSNRDLSSKEIQPLAKYRARNHIKHKRGYITHTHTSCRCYLLTHTDPKNVPVWTLEHIHTNFFFRKNNFAYLKVVQ